MSLQASVEASVEAAAGLVQRGDRDRFAAIMACAPEQRGVLVAVAAFNLELARAAWASAEPMVCEMRLQWWADALERGSIAHEIGAAVEAAVAAGAPVAALQAAIEARRWDCYAEPFASAAAFEAYLAGSSGGLLWAGARALGASEAAEPWLCDAGWALGLARLFLAVPELEARGRAPLYDGRGEAVSALAGEGLYRLARAREGFAALRGPERAVERAAAKAAMMPLWQVRGHLLRAQAEPSRVGAGALEGSEIGRRFGLLWAALRQPI